MRVSHPTTPTEREALQKEVVTFQAKAAASQAKVAAERERALQKEALLSLQESARLEEGGTYWEAYNLRPRSLRLRAAESKRAQLEASRKHGEPLR